MFSSHGVRRSRFCGLFDAPRRLRRHHPDFDRLASQGWKATDAEGRLSERGWRKGRETAD
jgi:agmatinase